jgi:DNA uptake protein ComE-like DNA-binding protein
MTLRYGLHSLGLASVAVALLFAVPVDAQVAQGLVDPNVATEQELLALPHMNPGIVKALMARRPLLSAVELSEFLEGQSLPAGQITDLFSDAFVHVNLNTATAAEIVLIPGAGKRMAHEFDEYRPWTSFAQFDREIGKYVDAAEVQRLKSYTFISLKLNTASEADFMTIPGVGKRMAHEFDEYRPWKTKAQFEKEIGKYVDEKEVARLWRYVTIQ